MSIFMKNIFGRTTMLLSACALLLTACSDDDGSKSFPNDGIKVTMAETAFDAEGGTKTITLNKKVTSVSAAEEWISASIEENVVRVSVDENPSMESRHSYVVIKAGEEDQTAITISQEGVIVNIEYDFTDAAYAAAPSGDTIAIFARHNIPIRVEGSDEWIHGETLGDSIYIYIDESQRNFRSGYAYVECGATRDSILISQMILEGNYLLTGTDENGSPISYEATLMPDGKYFKLTLTEKNYTVRVTYNEAEGKLSVSPRTTSCGRNGSYYVYLAFLEPNAASTFIPNWENTWATSANMTADLTHDSETDEFSALFVDGGNWSGHEATAWGFLSFTKTQRNLSNFVSAEIIQGPRLVKPGRNS